MEDLSDASLANADENALEKLVFERLVEFAAGAGHELNNPLAVASMLAQTLLKDEADPNRRLALSKIIEQMRVGYEMLASLRSFASPPTPKLARLDAREFFQDWTRREIARFAPLGTEFETVDDLQEGAALVVDSAMLSAALTELVKNGAEHGARVRLFARVATVGASKKIELGVEDDGPGLTEETKRLASAPYFSGRRAGRGLGFGVSLARRYAEVMGGRLLCGATQYFPTGARWSVEFDACE